jgi:predicted nucleotidyltransferase
MSLRPVDGGGVLRRDPALAEVVRRLRDVFQPNRIYLFGSRARGDAGTDSDYDLMVVVRDDMPGPLRRPGVAYKALRGTGVAADILVWTQDAFQSRLSLRASLPTTVVEEGTLLYES